MGAQPKAPDVDATLVHRRILCGSALARDGARRTATLCGSALARDWARRTATLCGSALARDWAYGNTHRAQARSHNGGGFRIH